MDTVARPGPYMQMTMAKVCDGDPAVNQCAEVLSHSIT
jgi:hypothetical protein